MKRLFPRAAHCCVSGLYFESCSHACAIAVRVPEMTIPATIGNTSNKHWRLSNFCKRHLRNTGVVVKAVMDKTTGEPSPQTANQPISSQKVISIASNCTAEDVAAKARAHNVSQRTVRRSLSSSAYAILQTFCVICELMLEELRLDPPFWAACFPQWDETKMKLVFNIGGRCIRQSVHVMVSKLVIAWGWPDRPPHFIEFVIPPDACADHGLEQHQGRLGKFILRTCLLQVLYGDHRPRNVAFEMAIRVQGSCFW